MIGLSWQEILNKYFYSSHNSKTPMWVALFTIALNLGLSLALSPLYGEAGIALASTLSVTFMAAALFFLAKRGNNWPDFHVLLKDIVKGGLAALCMGALLFALDRVCPPARGFFLQFYACLFFGAGVG
jgi:putative peptidoglycan lipid II flippase